MRKCSPQKWHTNPNKSAPAYGAGAEATVRITNRKSNRPMSNGKEGLPEVSGARLVAAFAYTFAERADYDAAFDAAEAWLEAQKAEATNPLERMVQELEAENARLTQELALAESRLAEAWDEGHEDGQHNEHEYRPGRQLTNPYRAGGDAQ